MKSERLKETVSPKGHPVTLAKECGSYFGAHPYYTATRAAKAGTTSDRAARRYTPFLDRAEAYYHAFAQDITDPQQLKEFVTRAVTS